jgi:hypothetical protein
MMKALVISKFKFKTPFPDPDEISEKLDSVQERHLINTANWADFSYIPEVSFAIAHSGREILLKYYVTENHFKAEKIRTNDNVYEDSCVEFFVSPADDGIYYNMEFNGLGTCLMGSGSARENSIRADAAIVSKIRRKSSVGAAPVAPVEGTYSWDITIAISPSVFFRHNITDFEGRTFRANFYKCGDKLKVPHYITWAPIATPGPDFHQPSYFGLLKFQGWQ